MPSGPEHAQQADRKADGQRTAREPHPGDDRCPAAAIQGDPGSQVQAGRGQTPSGPEGWRTSGRAVDRMR
jgi:hypothetical protein